MVKDQAPFEKRQTAVDYSLSPEQITNYEQQLASLIDEKIGLADDVYAIWMEPSSSFANIVRTYEKTFWHDIDEIMAPHEDDSLFLALFDARGDVGKVVHGFRVSRGSQEFQNDESDSTGIVLIDDIVNSGQGFTAAEFRAYYRNKGIDLSKCLSVETNFKVQRAEHYNGLPMSQIGYIAIFDLIKDSLDDDLCIFASINNLATQSFQLVGIQYEPIAGREDLKIPVSEGEFDDDYTGVALPPTKKNVDIFTNLIPFAAPSIRVE